MKITKNRLRRIIRESMDSPLKAEKYAFNKMLTRVLQDINEESIPFGNDKEVVAAIDAVEAAMLNLQHVVFNSHAGEQLRESLNEMDLNKYYDRMPESAMDRIIPAGHLEDILNTDGLQEFTEELAFYCEILENGDEPYHIMEPAEHRFIVDAIEDFAEDGDMDFAKWLDKSGFDNVIVGEDATEANFIRWTMR